MSPAEITALCGGIAAIVAAFYGGGALKEKKLNGDTHKTPLSVGVEKVGVKECEAVQEKFIIITDNLAKGQADIKAESKEGLSNVEASIIKLTDEARTGRDKIYGKMEELTKKVYKQGG